MFNCPTSRLICFCICAFPAVWSLFTCLTPIAAANSTFALLFARVMLGVGEGVAFPSIHSLICESDAAFMHI